MSFGGSCVDGGGGILNGDEGWERVESGGGGER